MVWFWLSLAIALLVIELSTTQFVSIWFAIGAGVTSLIKAIFTDIGVIWQAMIFVLISAVLLIATRPFVKRFLHKKGKDSETNLELVLGKEAIVVEEINNIKGEGAIKINGLVWSARSSDNSQIPVDTVVVFKEIDGVKAIVERKGE